MIDKKVLILVLAIVSSFSLKSQGLARFNFFNTPELAFPIYSQYNKKVSVDMQNVLFNYGNSPLRYRMGLSGRTQLGESHGVGVNFYTDLSNNFNYFRYQTGYSYGIQLTEDLYLHPGISFGLHQIKYERDFKPNTIGGDTTVNVARSSFTFDIDAGLGLTGKNLNFFIGVSNLLASEYLFNRNFRTLRFLINNRFDLIGEFGFTPGAYLQSRMYQNSIFNFDDRNGYFEIDLKFDYKQKFWLSGLYRYSAFYGNYLGFRIGGHFKRIHFHYGLVPQVGGNFALPGGSNYNEIGLFYRFNP